MTDAATPVSRCYVFGMSPEGEPVLAGQLSIARTAGTFVYDPGWLNATHTYPIDPVNLPLQPGSHQCRHHAPACADVIGRP